MENLIKTHRQELDRLRRNKRKQKQKGKQQQQQAKLQYSGLAKPPQAAVTSASSSLQRSDSKKSKQGIVRQSGSNTPVQVSTLTMIHAILTTEC